MAYSTELKRKARDLYIIKGKSLRVTAKILNFSRWQTIQSWAKQDKWRQKRADLTSKEAFKELAKDKREYIVENLHLADLNKKTGEYFLLKIYEELNQAKPDLERMQELAGLYRTVSSALNKSILIQHKILSGDYDPNKQEQIDLMKQRTLSLIINRANEIHNKNKPLIGLSL